MFEKPDIAALDQATLRALEAGAHAEPFAILGPHETARGHVLRVYVPGAWRVEARTRNGDRILAVLDQRQLPGLFSGLLARDVSYILAIHWPGAVQLVADAYSFGPLLSDLDLHLIGEGRMRDLAGCLGAYPMRVNEIDGVRFAVWAPHAARVAVVGDFNTWDDRRHAMRRRGEVGVWELFVPGVGPGDLYKFAIRGPDGARLPFKADPFARRAEAPPATASVVARPLAHEWQDGAWMARRAERQSRNAPISIYEVHLASWMRPHGRTPDWDTLRERLVPYASALRFTHIEIMPIAEYPFGGSWGYQPVSLFAPTARHGDADGLARFVDACHAAGLGVILDWTPAHFPADEHGLARFDGAALYEYADPREGVHRDWRTLIYDFGRPQVQAFLVASALYWLEHFHFDGLRVDAVSSMLYRDYSRPSGEWTPNIHGGNENLEAIALLRRLNAEVAARCPGAMVIAEESTAWPGVTRAAEAGGLGFTFKWNMGWMNDTLRYLAREPVHRPYHHGDVSHTFSFAHDEAFVLPLSHDEVAHGKGSLWSKAPGDAETKLSQLRACYALMWTTPGKKLLFMGGEFGQKREWDHDSPLAWDHLDAPGHVGLLALVRDLNRLYRTEPALHASDCDRAGFRWIVGDDNTQSVFAWLRQSPGAPSVAAIVNLGPAHIETYVIGAPCAGPWRQALNTDARLYGGQGRAGAMPLDASALPLVARPEPSHGFDHSLAVTLAPFSAIVLRTESEPAAAL